MRSGFPLASAAILAVAATGCFFAKIDRDLDRTPTMDAGVGGAILLPSQSAPILAPGGGVAPGGATSVAEPGSGQSSRVQSGDPGASSPRISMIGGSQIDEERHLSARSEPVWWKYVTLPFALVAAPFKIAADSVRGDTPPAPGPKVPDQKPQQAPVARPAPPADYESARVNELDQELDRRAATATKPPAPAPRRAGASTSIADELAALERVPSTGHPEAAGAPAPGPVGASAAPAPTLPPAPGPVGASAAPAPTLPPAPGPAHGLVPAQAADGIVDRNQDGRVDLWIYRQDGEIVRRVLDEDFDGRADRSVVYDSASQQIARIEEDTDQDGTIDAWTEYQSGTILRRRADTNHDGVVDTWTFYQGGQIVRHEQDSTGNGYRDRVGLYVDGHLERDEVDSNGDGRPDLFNRYDEREQVVQRDEDTDFDGRVDRVSYFESGRLARREILDTETR